MKDFFCEECALQFGKKLVFDLHLSLVHGKKTILKKNQALMSLKKVRNCFKVTKLLELND